MLPHALLLFFVVQKTISPDPRCSSPFGLFPESTSCDRYISCWGGQGFSLTCGSGMVFNAATSSCQNGTECPQGHISVPFSGQPIRLRDSHQQGTGRLELFTTDGWAEVVATSFTGVAADLVCRRLGYERVSTWFSHLPLKNNSRLAAHLRCSDNANSLLRCTTEVCHQCNSANQSVIIKCQVESSSRCPQTSNLWRRWRHSCYLVSDETVRVSRAEAFRECQSVGANLVAIESQMEHEFISTTLENRSPTMEFYTDGAGVVLANGGIMWAWQRARLPLLHRRWWSGWNDPTEYTDFLFTEITPSPACLVLKRSFSLEGSELTHVLGSTSASQPTSVEYDSGFHFFSPSDCSRQRSFICETSLKNVGCSDDFEITYAGSANISIGGFPCLKWSSPEINELIGRAAHGRTKPSNVFNISLLGDHNYCRNPNNSPRPWCFVGPQITEECDVPLCKQVDLPLLSTAPSSFLTNSIDQSTTRTLISSTGSFVSSNPFVGGDSIQSLVNQTGLNSDLHFEKKVEKEKVRCKSDEYHCDRSDICIKLVSLCDGTHHCPEGDDEVSCKRFLKSFQPFIGMTVATRNLIRKSVREEIGVCAKWCLDDSRCKGIVFGRANGECGLSRLNVGESGLKSSSSEEFYEVLSRKRLCGQKFKCHNGRCLPKSSVCNGRNDCLDNSDEAHCLAPLQHQLRLIGGSATHEGTVEIKIEDKWGYICDDRFGWNEADVICKELGYSEGALKFTRNNHFGERTRAWLRSSPHYWLSNLECTGLERSIVQCLSSGLGHHECGPTEIAGVICQTNATKRDNPCGQERFSCGDGSGCITRTLVCNGYIDCPDLSDESPELCQDWGVTRLLTTNGASGHSVGTVHVKHDGSWGTVCDDYFDDEHAKVVCRSLGYETDWSTAYPKSHFGKGSGNVLIDEPGCKGHESHLSLCSNHTWGSGNCDHSEDVGVFCSDKEDVRLVGGQKQDEGRVEIFLSGLWGTICDDDFDDYDATVICRFLGYENGGIAHKGGLFGKGSGPVWLHHVDCSGNETSLSQCKKSPPGTSACSHAEDAGVTCFVNEPKSFEKSLRNKLPGDCGRRLTSFDQFYYDSIAKIVGGRSITRLDSPWLVSLQLTENGSQKHNCAGVVISGDFVLTAAHCFRTHDKDSYVVRVGDFDLLTRELSQEDFLIEKLYVHDDFDTKVEFNNDIAIIKVSRKNGRGIKLNGVIQPVCLPDSFVSYPSASDCKITGWGTTSERAEPIPMRRPREGNVKIFPMDTCVGPKKYGAHEVTTGMFCAGQLDGSVDTCTGDSGGPLTCYQNGRHVLYGITSWGKGCGRRGQPGMYTKITKYLRWLNTIIP